MSIDQVSNLQALGFVALLLAGSWALFRAIPDGRAGPRAVPRRFTEQEITAYDGALPKYALAALVALLVGGVHAAVKSLPPVYAWLSTGGHGGHLVRDIANTHLNIVVGGTVAATGLVWYVLPRVARRPLHSTALATWSFWCTVIGAGGFYLANVVIGTLLARQAHAGIPYEVAEDALGAAKAIPVGLSATIMGIGYWTFVANVWLTVRDARRVVADQPQRHLLKFFVVGAAGLFVGTVQGVIQVMPAPEAWIRSAGPAGAFIDPIAHAHVNLVTGSLVLVAGLVFWWSRTNGSRRREQVVFWTLVPGSVAFYLTFFSLGVVEGRRVRAGEEWLRVVDDLGAWHVVPLAVSGTVMLVGVWLLLAAVVRRAWRTPGPARPWLLLAAGSLVVGTSQGLVQLAPALKRWLVLAGEPGDAVANAHAQLNMLGGVIPALIGLLVAFGPVFLGAAVTRRLARRAAVLVGAGIGVYYVGALAAAVLAARAADAAPGHVHGALAHAPWWAPTLMSLGSILLTAGVLAVTRHGWAATAGWRRTARAEWRASLGAYDGTQPSWRGLVPARRYLLAETAGALVGFPGIGWLLAGRATVGVPAALAGPGLAWAVLPLLVSPYSQTFLSPVGYGAIAGYLVLSTLVSVTLLAAVLRGDRTAREPAADPSRARSLPGRPPAESSEVVRR